MIVRDVQKLKHTDRHVVTENWSSTRLVVRSDGLGYSVHHTVIPEGFEVHCHYKDHFETNYCIAGEGEVLDIATGERHQLKVGNVYALDRHDEHIVRALRGELHLVCVFNPPLHGEERHNDHGGYDID